MMTQLQATADGDFRQRMRGRFAGVLRWPQLDELWERVRSRPEGWYLYHVGDEVPQAPADADTLRRFIAELDVLLRREHEEDYCGIVYADSREEPTLIKVYDPNNLGVVCGPGKETIPPGWLLSRVRPEDVSANVVIPNNRRRWWQRIFA